MGNPKGGVKRENHKNKRGVIDPDLGNVKLWEKPLEEEQGRINPYVPRGQGGTGPRWADKIDNKRRVRTNKILATPTNGLGRHKQKNAIGPPQRLGTIMARKLWRDPEGKGVETEEEKWAALGRGDRSQLHENLATQVG